MVADVDEHQLRPAPIACSAMTLLLLVGMQGADRSGIAREHADSPRNRKPYQRSDHWRGFCGTGQNCSTALILARCKPGHGVAVERRLQTAYWMQSEVQPGGAVLGILGHP